MTHRRIRAASRSVDAEFQASPSKSDTHRALVAAALASGRSEVVGPLDADDTRRTRDGLAALGFDVGDVSGAWTVLGQAGRVPGGGVVEFGPSGTTCRLLTAVASLGEIASSLDGDPRLRERPLGPLVDALIGLGAVVRADSATRGLPLVAGGRPPRGGAVAVPAAASSQFASALLMVGPCLPEGLRLELVPPVVSRPYLEMTIRTMAAFGVTTEVGHDGLALAVRPGGYRARTYAVEGDWSSASYLLALPALVGGRVRVRGLSSASPQADARFASLLGASGLSVRSDADGVEVEGGPGLSAFDVDASDVPDLVPTLAVVALAADGPCRMRGIGHLRLKESDRLAQLAGNLARMGAAVRTDADVLEVCASGRRLTGADVATASDHRIAMAFALAGLRVDGVAIDDTTCVAKSYPAFWSDFARVEGSAQNW